MVRRVKAKIKRKGSRKARLLYGVIILVAVSLYIISFISTRYAGRVTYTDLSKFRNLELPAISDSTYFVKCQEGRYSYMYSPKDKQSLWVAYNLTANDLKNKPVKRSNNFTPSPQVIAKGWESAYKSDYKGSSYDRGHLVPSRDRAQTKAENEATFYFSNISPQKGRLNRVGWRLLEEYVRDVANKYGKVYVTTGVVFKADDLKYIGNNKVTIPSHLYKVILTKHNDIWMSVGFLIQNSEDAQSNYLSYIKSVNEIEAITGIDFFTHLDDASEEDCESSSKFIKLN